MPTTIELKDEICGNFFHNFGNIETLEEPLAVQNALFIKDFSNRIDLIRLDHVDLLYIYFFLLYFSFVLILY